VFKLSDRLQLIYDQCIPGEPLWDFCCDHGYLGIHALKSGAFPEVHFVDQAAHLVNRLEQLWLAKRDEASVNSQAFFHPYAGENVNQEITGNVVIAGVGAHTIVQILTESMSADRLNARRLLLCPQRDEDMLKDIFGASVALRSAYNYVTEMQIVERSRIRKLLIFDRKD
jgi:tRNA (adenine22-N1)-methyltransferase